MGCVVGSWSCMYPQVLRDPENVVQASVNLVPSALDKAALNSANDSLSHRSSHHFMVTRSPNHMCAISCRITVARSSYIMSVTLDRNSNRSEKVTQPMFSMAPAANSGTKTWSYFANGYGISNRAV